MQQEQIAQARRNDPIGVESNVQAALQHELVKLSPFYISPIFRRRLLVVAIVVTFLVVLLVASRPVAPLSMIGAMIVCLVALMPVLIGLARNIPGLPLFQFVAASFVFSYGLPLVSGSPAFLQYSTVDNMVIDYAPADHFAAAMKTSLYLLIATFAWFLTMSLPLVPPRTYRTIEPKVADAMFLLILGGSLLFQMALIGGWWDMDPGTVTLIRVSTLGLSSLATAVLMYRAGKKQTDKSVGNVGKLFVIGLGVVSNLTLYLNFGILILIIGLLSYYYGKHRFPIIPLIALGVFTTLLHHGKGEMRYRYWHLPRIEQRETERIQPQQYLDKYAEWLWLGLDDIRYSARTERDNNLSNWRLLDRLGLVHNFLLVQKRAATGAGYLNGDSYSPILAALLPRILFPGKKYGPHEGQFRLNKNFGLRTGSESNRTFIEWGLYAEAFANFGLAGIIVFGVITGLFFATLTRISVFTPILSLRTILAVVLGLGYLQFGSTAGVYAVTITQTGLLLILVAIFLMKTQPFVLVGIRR